MTFPRGWRRCTLGSLPLRISGGVSVSGEDRRASPGERAVLTLSALRGGVFRPEEHKAVTGAGAERLRTAVRGDSVLISRSNTSELVGISAYVDRDYPNLFLPDLIWVLTAASETLSARWLSLALSSQFARRQIRGMASGTSGSMKKISMAALRRMALAVPSYREQTAIAGAVVIWDMRVRVLETLLAEKRRAKLELMRRFLVGHRSIGEVENTWSAHCLGDLFAERVEMGRQDLPLLSITADRGVIPREVVNRKDTSSTDKSRYLRILPGDIGYNTMRMWQGVSALSSLEGLVSPAYTVLVPRDRINSRFAAALFKCGPIVNLFRRHSQGLVDDTLLLKYRDFARIRVLIPSMGEQRKIAALFDLLDRELDLLGRLATAVRRQRCAVLDQLLSGELRLFRR